MEKAKEEFNQIKNQLKNFNNKYKSFKTEL